MLPPIDFKVALFRQLGQDFGVDVSTAGFVLTSNGPTVLPSFQAPGGGGGSPAAPDTSVQFNNGGAFGGSADHIWDTAKRSVFLGGGAEPDLSPYDNDSLNGFSVVVEGAVSQSNRVCAQDGFVAVQESIYRSRGTLAAPADNQSGDSLWVVDVLGFNNGQYQYMAGIEASVSVDPLKGILQLFAFDTAGGGGNASVLMDSRLGVVSLNALQVVIPTSLAVSNDVQAATYHTGVLAGIDAAITTAGLVGKTITVSKGLITGFA